MSFQSKKLQNESEKFAIEVNGILDDLLKLIVKTKSVAQKGGFEKQKWVNDWIETAEEIGDKLENYAERVNIAQFFKKVDNETMAPMTRLLIEVVKAMDIVTQNMYNLQNYFQTCKLMKIKQDMEAKIVKTQQEEADIQKKIVDMKAQIAEIFKENERKKKEEDEKKMRERVRAEAKAEVAEMLRERAVRQRMKIERAYPQEENTSQVENCDTFESTVMEEPQVTRHMRRRSRSLGKRMMYAVKKSVRRSISAFNNYIDHHHHHESHQSPDSTLRLDEKR